MEVSGEEGKENQVADDVPLLTIAAATSSDVSPDSGAGARPSSAPIETFDLEGIQFKFGDAAHEQYHATGHDFSHIYVFDRVCSTRLARYGGLSMCGQVFARATMRGLAKALHSSPFRVTAVDDPCWHFDVCGIRC